MRGCVEREREGVLRGVLMGIRERVRVGVYCAEVWNGICEVI